MLWQLVGSSCVIVALFLLIRAYFDNGGGLPLGKYYYARRWVNPTGPTGIQVQNWMKEICTESVGELLPHRALHDLAALADNKLVLIVFEKKTNKPVMFHLAFKASYVKELVIHLGLVMVVPMHQGRHLQRLCMLNLFLSCFTYFKTKFVLTEIANSPSSTKMFGDYILDSFPNYRHNNSIGPEPWQLEIAQYMMDNHREDFGTSEDAKFDPKSFVVRDSNKGQGGSAVLSKHADKRQSRTGTVNNFVSKLIQNEDDEVFHVGRASFMYTATIDYIRNSSFVRNIVAAIEHIRLVPMALYSAYDRYDAAQNCFKNFVRRNNISISKLNEPTTEAGVLWISNHYSWMDIGVIQSASARLIRPLVGDGVAKEGIFGTIGRVFMKQLNSIEYVRGDKASGYSARQEIKQALLNGDSVIVFPEGASRVDGPPIPFRKGGMKTAFEINKPVQPCALWYSEPVGYEKNRAGEGTAAAVITWPTQVIANFAPIIRPDDYETADSFADACEKAVNDAYKQIEGKGV
jgi:1-acyl-sn-glycerol-3-phosphate acyltransferase